MIYFLAALALLFSAGIIYLTVNGIQMQRRLLQLKSELNSCPSGFDFGPLLLDYSNHVFFTHTERQKAYENNLHPALSVPGLDDPDEPRQGVKEEFIEFLSKFIGEFNDDYYTNIKLELIDGNSSLPFRDSVTLLRIIFLLADKCLKNKMELTSIFILAIDPLQLSIEATKPASHDHSDLYTTVLPELATSASIQIIHYEVYDCHERLVLGANRDDKDSSSRRPRDFQGKY